MLDAKFSRASTSPGATERLILHPVEVRQLRLRHDELTEEVAFVTSTDARDAVIAQLVHVREILRRCDGGTASVTRRAGLAA